MLEEQPEVPANPPEPKKAPDHPTYREGVHYYMEPWREYTQYCCMKCQYSSLWFVKMAKHLDKGKHRWAFPRPDSDPKPVDKNGDPDY